MGIVSMLVTVSLFAIFTAVVVQIVIHGDYMKKVYNHQPGPCRLVDPVVDGSEDLELLSNGLVIVSSGLRYAKSPETDNIVGKLLLFDFNNVDQNKPKAVELKLIWTPTELKNFNPHGLKSHTSKTGEITLYVISHPPGGDRIELFTLDVEKKTAKHVKSIKHELIYAANNLAIVGPEEIYVSNDHYFSNHFLGQLEYKLPYIRLGNVVYYNKGKASVVDQFLLTPNGMAIDKNRKYLFVALPSDKALSVYKINNDKTITLHKKVQVDTAIDNLFLDEQSTTVWTGSHPLLYVLFDHVTFPKSVSAPSQVLRFQFKDATYSEVSVFDPYMNDGSVLQASSAVVKFKNQILIGTVDHKLLLCDLTNQ